MRAGAHLAVIITAALALSVACSTEPNAADTTITDSVASPASEDLSEPSGLTVDVRIENGSVTPTNVRYDASVGEEITVTVDSDTSDELHVHSVPEHSFEIEAAEGQSFEFTVEVPGQVALELHHADRTIATLVVRP
ncbi:hypothetical protein [Rhodococcoides yunnanense]|uniref:hypothetical protein n=1 Tax=Rhodococcoides yunnanense TaxID=278209 RepID=UPI0009327B3B|nr:hypothetical protein [Rhodococcus yunnanensis]